MKKKLDKNTPLNQWPLYDVEARLSHYRRLLQLELKSYGISLDFHLWISDEWFCPDGVPGFALPFYLFNPQLKALHRKETGVIEGRSEKEILRLMRHELGHAIDNAYGFRKNRERQRVFGGSDAEYPDSYSPKLYSKNYVRYLGEGYAQSHPDEDFAETFAYWLDPNKKWRMKAFSKSLQEKLNCMDRLMRIVRTQKPVLKNRFRIDPIEKNTQTLAQFYRDYHWNRKSAALKRVDQNLQESFSFTSKKEMSLSFYLRKEKQYLKRQLSREEGVYQYEAERALQKIIERAEGLSIQGSISEFQRKSPKIIKKNFRYLRDRQLLSVYL